MDVPSEPCSASHWWACPSVNLPVVAVLMVRPPQNGMASGAGGRFGIGSSHGQWFAALVQRLRELGWIEGRTV